MRTNGAFGFNVGGKPDRRDKRRIFPTIISFRPCRMYLHDDTTLHFMLGASLINIALRIDAAKLEWHHSFRPQKNSS